MKICFECRYCMRVKRRPGGSHEDVWCSAFPEETIPTKDPVTGRTGFMMTNDLGGGYFVEDAQEAMPSCRSKNSNGECERHEPGRPMLITKKKKDTVRALSLEPVEMPDGCRPSTWMGRLRRLTRGGLILSASLLLAGCGWGEAFGRASPGARDGAPYYRGQPGGEPIRVAPPINYRVPLGGGGRPLFDVFYVDNSLVGTCECDIAACKQDQCPLGGGG